MAYTTLRFSDDSSFNDGAVSGSIIAVPREGGVGRGGYPTTLGGLTFGWAPGVEALGASASTGWVAGDDIRLRGRWRRSNESAPFVIRLDVTPGDYRILGSTAAHSFQRNRLRIRDGVNGVLRLDRTSQSNTSFTNDDAPNRDQCVDLNGVVRAIGADALVGTPEVVSITSGVMEIVNGGHASGLHSSDLSFIAFERVEAPAPVPVADGLQFVPGSLPSSPVPGTPYTLEVEAWDSVLNVRVTSYDDPTITLGEDLALPSDYDIASGDLTQPMVGGLATFPLITFAAETPEPPAPGALEAPVLSFGAPTDAPTTRTVVLSYTGPSSWPAGVTVQLQSRYGTAAFVNDGAPISAPRTFVLPRASEAQTFSVRGIAQAPGDTPADSVASTAISITVPALPPAPIAPITAATPLRCAVALFPPTTIPTQATGGGGIPTLLARTATDHLLRITGIAAAVTGAPVEPTDIRYVVADATGVLVDSMISAPTSPDVWQIALSRALFTSTRGALSLTLTLVAPDTTETQLLYTLAQGVNQ